MSFDWFTFIAQLVNFALLVLLLRVFLYRPGLDMMDAREKRIADAWQAAEQARSGAREQERLLQDEHALLVEKRRERLAAVESEAQELLERRLQETYAEAEDFRARQSAALRQGRQRTVESLRQRSAGLLLDELRTALASLAGTGLEEFSISRFGQKMEELPGQQRALLGEGPLTVTSAVSLEPALQEQLRALVERSLGAGRPVSFNVDPELLFGLELTAGPRQVALSGRQHLEALQRGFSAALASLEAEGEPGDD